MRKIPALIFPEICEREKFVFLLFSASATETLITNKDDLMITRN